jgi:two-component system NarL family response regulator
MTFRILLADDHQMFREALRLLLERSGEFEIVGETGDGSRVIPLVEQTRPDLLCLDIEMPGLNGVDIARQMKTCCPDVRIIALSSHVDRGYVMDMLAAGAAGYVAKSGAGAELLRAIDAIMRDRSYLCPEATHALRDDISCRQASPHTRLGSREIEVLKLVAAGYTSVQIAAKLGIAQSTVEVHRRNIMRKLELNSAVDMTRYAIREGLLVEHRT